MIRTALRVLYPLGLVLGLLVFAGPASAAFGLGDCKDPPVAEAPGGGISGFFGTPDKPPADPKGGAFVKGAPRYENYGMAGLTFTNYDLGCGPDITRDPGAVIGTTIGNWTFEISKFAVAATGGLLSAAYNPTYLQTFDPLLRNATKTLRETIYDDWVPVTIAAIGIMLLWRSNKGNWAQTVTVVAWAIFVMVVATMVFTWPVKAGSAADGTMGTTIAAVTKGINGQGTTQNPADAATGALSNVVLYQQWKMGTFGRSNSATADKYARDLYTSQALTYAEAAKVRADPDGKGKALMEAKAEKWKATAEKIEQADPDAYQYLSGKRGTGRVSAGFVSLFAALCTVPFLFASAVLMIGAYLIIRLAVVFFPVIAVLGIAHAARGAVIGIGTVVGAAVVNCILFGIGSAVTILAGGILLSPTSGIPLWLALCLMGVFSFIMWVALKPVRRLTKMASGANVFSNAAGAVGSAASSTKDAVVSTGQMALASYTGNAAALAGAMKDDESIDLGNKRRTEGNATPPPTAAPTPAPPPTPLANTPVPAGLPPGGSRPMPPGPAASEHGVMPMPGPGNLPEPTSTPLPQSAPTPGSVRDDEGISPTFVPGDAPAGVPDTPLPRVAEPQIDEATGEEIYVLFDPDAEDAK